MIGIDILENERIREKLAKPEFLNSFLTDDEQKYVSSFADKTERVTGLFCVKEAVKKAFGCPPIMDFLSIEIHHFENGKPYVVFNEKLTEITSDYAVEISISHSKTITVAVCVIFPQLSLFDDNCCCEESDKKNNCECKKRKK